MMLTFRIAAAVGLAVALAALVPATAHAGEISPPEGAKVEFKGTPGTTSTGIKAAGSYKVPDGWRKAARDPVELRLYKVKADGSKGDFIKKFDGSTEDENVWRANASALDPDTEYYVEAKFKFVKNALPQDYAYRTTEAVKVKTKPRAPAPGGGEEEVDVVAP
ncbi:hypothetical protein R5W24_002038 [Gemmata sp. JC717]|uniref:hypothetical protein n=1 Tax=Gemmata algarum TaxID=2975278 RepID=UPI0021BB9AE1|nr:hypothetical protein [Gemmata algarum]MDY3552948.1 hypothetical protein [Gemmata algarum]